MGKEIFRYHEKQKVFPVLVGEKVTLKPVHGEAKLEKMFYEMYTEWLTHEDIVRGVGEEDTAIEEIVRMHSEWKENPGNLTLAIYDNETGKPVGDVNLFDTDEFEEGPEIAIMIGERGKGFGTESMELMLNYAFNTIGVSKVNLTVFKDNPAEKLFRKLGFETTGEKVDEDTGREEYEMSFKKEGWKKK
ncbi:MAG: GNAT family N-acetyltransferase [Candidatus Pacearchaeota archaeon]|nr:GNAT family N-acetyltransferase [Candidatus Pacearchaeota archaeon]